MTNINIQITKINKQSINTQLLNNLQQRVFVSHAVTIIDNLDNLNDATFEIIILEY